MSNNLTEINVVVLGRGVVGSVWLDGSAELRSRFKNVANVKIVAVANSTRYLLDKNGLGIEQLNQYAQLSKAADLHQLIGALSDLELPNLVILDLTASDIVANRYLEFAERSWNVISANKIPLTKSTERHKLLINTFRANGCFWGINATVGAALPVQSSLSDLLQAGDKLQSITGVFSGSLSYLLSYYDGEQSFTDLIKQAKEVGMTEPDPRDDLSGTDVQRKLLILARIAGYSLNLEDIRVSPLLPQSLLDGDLNDFWNNAEAIDQFMAEKSAAAKKVGQKLAYQAKATFNGNVAEGEVSLVSLPLDNALTQLTPADNVFTLTTDFYLNNPLVIRGPGAGAIVTATAVNIDLNKYILQIAVAASGTGNPRTELY
ncbi:aspartate kinase [Psychrosphaera sp. B3R10]|uniref:Aspartate kinase n=1 Tax=Psychrosphaera algicola TaxID=3023714 RepID=A0ABT5FH13_9GAMM|nr:MULTISPECIES: aspartate kinase [unclassified Psychrosphaera]MBU2883030.1 aspartate kinase [Psychrosphaera sp. I2R16]MBU2988487.1 aspartate kinase [Psychrosphaera sp. B3R10]MDC2890465.1 aspartate kinase [Psychrosphaera sp. G1-22]MDO6721029.1 aspartate kinase [Psychrosphaera sp. 1_MG-2023]